MNSGLSWFRRRGLFDYATSRDLGNLTTERTVTSRYLVPKSFLVQGDDDHGRVGEEAPVVE